MLSIMHSQQVFSNFAVQTCTCCLYYLCYLLPGICPIARLEHCLRAAAIVSDASDDKKAATSIQYNALSGVNMAAQFIHCNIDYEALELETRCPHDSHGHTHTLTRYTCIHIEQLRGNFCLLSSPSSTRPLEPKCRVVCSWATLRIRINKVLEVAAHIIAVMKSIIILIHPQPTHTLAAL